MDRSLDERLKDAISRRDLVSAQSQKILGRKEAAEKSLSDIEDEIRAKNLDPHTLGETIKRLEAAYEAEVAALESAVEEAEIRIRPYLEKL